MLSLIGFLLIDLGSYLTSVLGSWMPITGVATLAVLSILGIVYGLSSMIGRTEFNAWVRAKMYDVAFSLFLLFIFAIIATSYIAMNPEPFYNDVNLVPSSSQGSLQDCQATTDIYSLSACDMYDFLHYTFNLNSFLYSAIIVTTMVPSIDFDFSKLFELLAPYGLGISFGISLSPIPIQSYFGQILGLLFPLFALNQMQLLLLSAAPLIFSVFMALGLIARLFGITRTFGGAMIAFAIGLGILYPLMVSLTYGFVDFGIQQQVNQWCANAGAGLCILNLKEWSALIFELIAILVAYMLNSLAIAPGVTTALLQAVLGQIIVYGGLVALGLTLVPFLNFLVVDTFIIDFSKAIGERMDLLSLLGGLV